MLSKAGARRLGKARDANVNRNNQAQRVRRQLKNFNLYSYMINIYINYNNFKNNTRYNQIEDKLNNT